MPWWCNAPDFAKQFNRLEQYLLRLIAEVRRIRFVLIRPRPVKLIVIGELSMALKFKVQLPVPPANPDDWAEVDHGTLSVVIPPNLAAITIDTAKAVQEETEGETPRCVSDDRFIGAQGTNVTMTFHYVDDAGNAGEPVVASQVLTDTVPPVAPTSIGLIETEEVPG